MDPISELVSLKQVRSVDQNHNRFVSLLNQIYLLEEHALSIFISNLLARQVEGILSGPTKISFIMNSGANPQIPFLPNSKPL